MPKCVLVVSTLLIFSGVLIIFGHGPFLRHLLRTSMVLAKGTKTFQAWEHIPERLPMDFYMFNWTNPQDINNASVKPKFEQIGPFKYWFDLVKANVTWNDNGTVTYEQKKYWFFDEEATKVNLSSVINTLNTPAVGAAHQVRNWSYFPRKATSLTLSSFYSNISFTASVEELLFKGLNDSLTRMASSLSIFADDIPQMDKFGYFYQRNGSSDLDGVYTVGTGSGTKFGEMFAWNYMQQTPFFDGSCGKIDGNSGVNFDVSSNPDTIRMFVPEMCRTLVFEYVGDKEVDGLIGRKYVIGDRTLDNGTKFESNRCYCTGECIPSGIFNISSCRYGSPTFLSLPHFYNADSYYTNAVEGLNPESDKHEFGMVIEPRTGIPLQVNARIQVNFLLQPVKGVTLFKNVPRVFFPVMWFDQEGRVPRNNVFLLKLLLNAPTICLVGGSVMMGVGVAMIIYFFFMKRNEEKRIREKDKEEMYPLNGHTKLLKQ